MNASAFLGATATLVQIVLWATGSQTLPFTWAFMLTVTAGCLLIIWRSLPSSHLRMTHSSFAASFEITYGDIFTVEDGTIAITANRHFDFKPDHVSPESLIAQLVDRWFDGDHTPLATAVGPPAQAVEAPVGTVITLAAGERTALLLAVAQRSDTHSSSVLVGDITAAESSLWEVARLHNLKELTVPLIGSGLARAQIGSLPLLMLMLTSYITASMEVPVCHLRIVLSEDAVDVTTAIEVCHEYATALGFVKT